MLGDTYLMG